MLDKFLIGGYTSDNYTPNNQSEGIYVATLDTDEAKIVSIEPYVKLDNPAFFNFDSNKSNHKLVTVLTKNENTGGVGIIDTTQSEGKLIDTKMLVQKGVTPAYEAYDASTNRYFWNELSYTVPSYVYLDAQRVALSLLPTTIPTLCTRLNLIINGTLLVSITILLKAPVPK